MARLRMGASELNINKKYIKKDPVLRCPFCPQDETELHFLKHCPNYDNLRQKYLDKHFNWHPDIGLNRILGSENPVVIKDIATFIYHAMKKRKEDLQSVRALQDMAGQRLITEFQSRAGPCSQSP